MVLPKTSRRLKKEGTETAMLFGEILVLLNLHIGGECSAVQIKKKVWLRRLTEDVNCPGVDK